MKETFQYLPRRHEEHEEFRKTKSLYFFRIQIPSSSLRGFVLAFFLCLNASCWAQSLTDAARLSIPLDNDLASARSAAFASAFVAVADDGSALFSNPAGLGALASGELSLHHQVWVGDTSLETLMIALPLENLGGLGVAVHYVNFGSFEGRDSLGNTEPSLSANRIALEGGWGMSLLRNFSVGLALRASQENLAGNLYQFFSLDGGLLFRLSPEWKIGLAFEGLGENGSQGDLPFALRGGTSFSPDLSRDWRLLVSGAGSVEAGGLSRLQTGVEAVYAGHYALRAGYQWDLVDNQLGGLNGLTLGVGYSWEGLSLDYAFLPMGDLGTSHRFSLSYHFGISSSAGRTASTDLSVPKANSGTESLPPSAASASPALPFNPKTSASISADASNAPPTASSPADSGNDLEIQFKLAPDTLKQGKELEQQGKYPEAIGLYTQAIQNDQKNLLAWWGLGNIYFRLGRRDYAVHCFEEVLKINPNMPGLTAWLKTYKSAPPARPGNP